MFLNIKKIIELIEVFIFMLLKFEHILIKKHKLFIYDFVNKKVNKKQ